VGAEKAINISFRRYANKFRARTPLFPPSGIRSGNMVMIAFTTGMRRGKISGLRWEDVGLNNGLIILPVTEDNTVRVLPINDTLHRILSEVAEKTGYVFGNGGDIGNIKHSFTSACRKMGIPDFWFHDQHTYAWHLAMPDHTFGVCKKCWGTIGWR
jgi:integrase